MALLLALWWIGAVALGAGILAFAAKRNRADG
jgi:hypothetical protein